MRTAHLPSMGIHASLATMMYWWGVRGPQVNKFEQVSSDDHQMSLVEGWRVPCLMLRGLGPEGARAMRGASLYSEVQCIMGNGHMGPLPLWTDRHGYENITTSSNNLLSPQVNKFEQVSSDGFQDVSVFF